LIEKNHLLQYFDTSVVIQDDILLEALKQGATHRMQDITATIQTEQNKIIHDTQHEIVLVNGVAGSGKSSTIMQRIAYLLYSFRKQMTADSCLILFPNHRFIDYIANVLPSLGERTPLNLTITKFLQQFLTPPLEDETSYFERISQATVDEQTAHLRSTAFLTFLKNTTYQPDDFFKAIHYKKQLLISREKINSLYQSTPAQATIQERIQVIKKLLLSDFERHLLRQAKSARIQNQLLALSEAQQMHYFGELIIDGSEQQLIHYAQTLLRKKHQGVQKQIEQLCWIDTLTMFQSFLQLYTKTKATLSTTLNVDEAVGLVLMTH